MRLTAPLTPMPPNRNNLKLPMKQRYLEVKKCEERIRSALEKAGFKVEIQFKQLYHDREEVTGHLRVS